ncbi:hypothetical protein [Halobacillus sp. BBL2006]|uniref:hypothetical protein n=1 Tax=Halobacillus sp. BBL2006 TaxID=1543706 RepID=UPI00054268EE|nr:hypothetical protein [Halobacillus sp. BBL2006]KHE71193.1 hypothetical protein LD39_10370 [Halobacillus sp. BBL2006]
MLKWFAIMIIGAVLFITGAFYGIDKNNEKLADAPTVKVKEQEEPSHSEGHCRPVTEQDDYPWIVEVAGGIGEGVSATFNGILLVLSEMIHSSSA